MKRNGSVSATDPPGQAPNRPRHDRTGARRLVCGPVIAALLGAALLAGCGGTKDNNGSVAHINASTAAGKSSTTSKTNASGLAYAHCMRSHGEPDFPDPNSHGDFGFSNSRTMNPQSPTFQAAQNDCRSLQPGRVSAAQENAQLNLALKAAACIRKHGYPSLPDPALSDGAVGINGNAMKGIDVSSPAFQAVAKKCGAPGGLF